MAHVGKDFPRMMRPDWGMRNDIRSSPPFRMRLITTAASTGTYTVKWRSMDLISEEPELDLVTSTITYRVLHPLDVLDQIRLTIEVKNAILPTGGFSNVWWQYHESFWEDDVQIAETFNVNTNPDPYAGSNLRLLGFDQWQSSDDRDLVDYQTGIQFCAARWEDIPWYKPRQPDHA